MAVSDRIQELIERFKFNEASYRSGSYNETQLRREFLDPFFEELGWDVNNTQGYAEAYKDVIHEDAIKVGSFAAPPAQGNLSTDPRRCDQGWWLHQSARLLLSHRRSTQVLP